MSVIEIFFRGLKGSFRNPSSTLATLLVLIVPLMYPLVWLQAFWSPYDNVGNLPVAFVNEDSGVYGQNLEQELQTSTDVKWVFTDRAEADAGLKAKTYYAIFIIPGDFSENIASAQTAGIEVYVDGKNNSMSVLLVTQIEKRLEEQVSSQIRINIAEKISGDSATVAFIANPIEGVVTDINPVANTGTGFAPYFSSLALWIGALLISLVIGLRVGEDRLPGAKGLNLAIGRYLLFAFMGVLQAGMLTAIIFALGINVQNGLLTFISLVVSSLTSVAIVSTLIVVFGMVGQMLSMFFLIFQLTASGGTFPTELTQGALFMTLHPFVPFTYSVNALREAISSASIDWTIVGQSLGIQLAVALLCLLLCVIVSRLKDSNPDRHETPAVSA
jgi:putative membrane protein